MLQGPVTLSRDLMIPRRLDLNPEELDWAASHLHLLDCQLRELSAGMQRLQQVYNDLAFRTMSLERHLGWIKQQVPS